eukprot:XP_001707707.1 Hypothetical protein GL50803_22939 [Giardia lamblia ATCC 50803]
MCPFPRPCYGYWQAKMCVSLEASRRIWEGHAMGALALEAAGLTEVRVDNVLSSGIHLIEAITSLLVKEFT